MNYWVHIKMPIDNITDINIKFINAMEKIIKEIMQHAETELEKAKYYKEMLELPSKRENWSIQDGAEEKMMNHTKRVLELMSEMGVLMEGLHIFKDGLIYRMEKEGIIKKTIRLE